VFTAFATASCFIGAKCTVTAVRRVVLIVGILVGVLLPARPVAAHICALPAHFTLHQHVILNVAVAAEDKPVRAVDISIPAGFALQDAEGFLGFQATRSGRQVHFEGGQIAIYDCESFSLEGEPTRTGKLVAPIVTTADDGTKTRYDDLKTGSQFPAQVIYVTATAAPRVRSANPAPRRELQLAVVVVAGLALFGVARSRRSSREQPER
jgi:hypothetical protein